jgi:hypothetical protein
MSPEQHLTRTPCTSTSNLDVLGAGGSNKSQYTDFTQKITNL